MLEGRAARNLVVTEEDPPLVFEHLGDLFEDARARSVAITEVGKQADPAGEKVITRGEYPDPPKWFGFECKKPVREFTEWVDLAFGLTEMLSFRLKLILKTMGVYPILAPPAIRRRLGFAEAMMPEINENLIRESWDDMARVLASVQEGVLHISRVFAHVRDLSPKAFEGFREVGRSARSRFLTTLLGDPKARARFDLSYIPPADSPPSPPSREERTRERDRRMAAWREKWGELSNGLSVALREAQSGNPVPLKDLLRRMGPDCMEEFHKESQSMLGSLSSVLAGDFADGNLDVEKLGFAPEDLLVGRDLPPEAAVPPLDVYGPCPCGSGKKFKFCCRGKDGADREAQATKRPSRRGIWTPPEGEPESQPIERIGLVAGNLDRLASDSREMFSIVLEGSRKAAALDDETVERLENVLEERLFHLGVYREQLRKWRSGPLTEEQSDGIAAAEKNLAVSQELTDRAREKVEKEIRPGTIDRVLDKSDIELGMEAVLRLLRTGDL